MIKDCFCGAKATYVYDYVIDGNHQKYHHYKCSNNPHHLKGVGCYNAAPGKNPSNKCDYCHTHNINCVVAASEWNKYD